MTPIEWDDELLTGDDAIDHQHRTIHALYARLVSGEDNALELVASLDILTEHILVHFSTEEELMALAAYPPALTRAHAGEHRLLVNGVRDQVLAFRSGELASIEPIAGFVREWLLTHIHQSDRQFIDYLKAAGYSADLSERWLETERRTSA